jgi:hypothetical protein
MATRMRGSEARIEAVNASPQCPIIHGREGPCRCRDLP